MRTSGILMPMSSLPSRFGIGSMGKEAYAFIDFLKASGQTWWQLLPIGPTSYGDSPYQSFSAFACNPYFIDLDALVSEKLLTPEEAESEAARDIPGTVDYLALFENRYRVLRKAVARMDCSDRGFVTFKAENAWWLDEYSLFMAIKESQGMRAFWEWPSALKHRSVQALEEVRKSLSEKIEFWSTLQYMFHKQWMKLKEYANKNGVRLMGDMPIYVSPDSVEFWADKKLFQVDEDGEMLRLAGCPPDAFSAKGQLWGNPLYDWDFHRKSGYEWWISRLAYAGKLFNAVRIDHFRGFASYYSVPAGSGDAVNGSWKKGPGRSLIDAIKVKVPNLFIIAEDLGFQTEDVKELLAYSGFPGMKVLQFAFDSREKSDYLPHNYGFNSVVYTGTHDNTTTMDWTVSAPPQDVRFACEYLGLNDDGHRNGSVNGDGGGSDRRNGSVNGDGGGSDHRNGGVNGDGEGSDHRNGSVNGDGGGSDHRNGSVNGDGGGSDHRNGSVNGDGGGSDHMNGSVNGDGDGSGDRHCTEAIIRAALSSVCSMAVIPLQDWLELGAEARMNIPSTVGGNWLWRAKAEAFTPELSERIFRLTDIYGRIPQ